MSTDTTPDLDHWLGRHEEGRFQRRAEPPDRLYGPPRVNYPDRDGRLMSDNTLQADWIHKIRGGLVTLFRDHPDVFVASDLMWYPVEGNNRRRLAPDVMVAFGRPKGYRGSYIQHDEQDVPPTVVFEILSPGNRKRVMDYKRRIYEMFGIEEYYVFDPYKISLEVWIGEGNLFRSIPEPSGWVSPRLSIRFELGENLTIFAPDGRPFLDYVDVATQRDESDRLAAQERERADALDRAVAHERGRADALDRAVAHERGRADAREQEAAIERRRAEAERDRAERLAARLRELGLEPDE